MQKIKLSKQKVILGKEYRKDVKKPSMLGKKNIRKKMVPISRFGKAILSRKFHTGWGHMIYWGIWDSSIG